MPPAPPGHEVDYLRRGELGGDDKVALVLARLIVDQYDHSAGGYVSNYFFDRIHGRECWVGIGRSRAGCKGKPLSSVADYGQD